MSGSDIPYQLRPNKFIDRQLFLELLTRLVVPHGLEKYVYISMGGRHLIDHYAVYSQLGINALYSFDKDENEVARQNFNRPTGSAVCVKMNSADLARKLGDVLAEFKSKTNLIVWLDYTSPSERRSQFQEALEAFERLQPGDVLRVTFNAEARTLAGGTEWIDKGFSGPGEYRLDKLKKQIGEYVPTDVQTIRETEFEVVLARCFELVVKKAEIRCPTLAFRPVLITSYADGRHRMLTVTCAVMDRENPTRFPAAEFKKWSFACRRWSDIREISVPVLSSKERYWIDGRLHHGRKKILDSLPFMPGENEEASLRAIQSYRTLHRYYPTFRNVED